MSCELPLKLLSRRRSGLGGSLIAGVIALREVGWESMISRGAYSCSLRTLTFVGGSVENVASSPVEATTGGRRTGRVIAKGCAVGCLTIAAIIALIIWGYRRKAVEEWTSNPEVRQESGREILGSNQLPKGYHTIDTASVPPPFEVEFVELSSEPPMIEGREMWAVGERLFIYIKYSSFGDSEQQIRDFFEGRVDDPQAYIERVNQDFDFTDVIGRGSFESGRQTVLYVAGHGTFRSGPRAYGSIVTLMLVDCPADNKMRSAIWTGPGQTGNAAEAEMDLAGTVAEEAEIRAFMAHFSLCWR